MRKIHGRTLASLRLPTPIDLALLACQLVKGRSLTTDLTVSRGFGLGGHGVNPLHDPRNMHKIVFEHLNELFPAPNGTLIGASAQGMNGFVNGALGGTGAGSSNTFLAFLILQSGLATCGWRYIENTDGQAGTDYWSWCFGVHIPQDVDLVLTELGASYISLSQPFLGKNRLT